MAAEAQGHQGARQIPVPGMQVDEIREKEDLPALGFNFIKLGLDSVLYNPETKEMYVANTDKTAKMDDLKRGGEKEDESGTEG